MTRTQVIERLSKDLALGLLINSLAAVLFVHIFYKSISAGFEGNQALTLISVLAILWIVFLMICSLSVFFNLYPVVRSNKFYIILTYYLLPVAAAVIAFSIEDSEAAPLILVVNIPFFVTQSVFLVRFIKAQKGASIDVVES